MANVVEQGGGQCATLTIDVTQSGARRNCRNRAPAARWNDDARERRGIIGTGSIETTTDDQWDTMMDINAGAPFRLMRAAVPALIESKGSIVNVSSVTGLRSFPGVLAYCVSKSAIDQLTRCAALELAAKGVRVNA